MELERPYDGCGKCLVGLRRLSRKTDATSSPERQRDHVLSAAEADGGHIIAWADDWEVSGATNPMTRPKLGPWLRNEMGPYDGVVGAAVDRLGRNLVDCLNTGYMMRDTGKRLITYGHDGPWNLSDPNDENQFIAQAWGAQMELRSIQRRNRDQSEKARTSGRPHGKPSYGFEYVRLTPNGKVDHVRHSPTSYAEITNVAKRVLANPTRVTPWSEAARLTREKVLSPNDYLRALYGNKPNGSAWHGSTLRKMLRSKAALGYLMHGEEPVIGNDGHPVRLPGPKGEPLQGLWDYPTHIALVKILDGNASGPLSTPRAPKGSQLLSGRNLCPNCGYHMQVNASGRPEKGDKRKTYTCVARVRGFPGAENCRPAPTITASILDEKVTGWFLTEYGDLQIMETIYDPGNGIPERIAEIKASRERLRADRGAGLYDSPEDAEWYRDRFAQMTAEMTALRNEPVRAPGMVKIPTGRTIEDEWNKAPDDAARRELLEEFRIMVTVWPEGSPRRWYAGPQHGPERADGSF